MADENIVVEHSDIDEPKATSMWFKDSKGNASASLTFVTIAFWITALAYLVSIIQKIGPVEFKPFDVAACGSFFGSCCALYFGRRYTEAKTK